MVNKAILLVRVSTSTQDYKAQIEDLQKHAKTFGFSKFKIIETKESGLLDLEHKSGTNELFNFVEKNPTVKTVFTTELSRLG
ncbi:MAG: recombinase family protein, partial [Bacteroidota bacterium]